MSQHVDPGSVSAETTAMSPLSSRRRKLVEEILKCCEIELVGEIRFLGDGADHNVYSSETRIGEVVIKIRKRFSKGNIVNNLSCLDSVYGLKLENGYRGKNLFPVASDVEKNEAIKNLDRCVEELRITPNRELYEFIKRIDFLTLRGGQTIVLQNLDLHTGNVRFGMDNVIRFFDPEPLLQYELQHAASVIAYWFKLGALGLESNNEQEAIKLIRLAQGFEERIYGLLPQALEWHFKTECLLADLRWCGRITMAHFQKENRRIMEGVNEVHQVVNHIWKRVGGWSTSNFHGGNDAG